jgi:hypothetical protein
VTGRRRLAGMASLVVAVALALAAGMVIASCSSGRPSGRSFFATDPSAASATITLTGTLNGRLTATSTPACLTRNGGIAPLSGALENDWKLSAAGASVGVLTWYVKSTADGTISLTDYAASITMTYGPHDLNGMTGTVVQTDGAHDIRFDVSFQDANDSKFVVHASGDVTC